MKRIKKNYIMDENDPECEYYKIPLGHIGTNVAVYSKIYFKVEINFETFTNTIYRFIVRVDYDEYNIIK